MQPTEHKHKNDELIAHIRQSLKTHEEFYQLGAWEKFNNKQQVKKRPIFWLSRISAAAAVLAVCFSLIWFTTRSPQAEQLTKAKLIKNNPLPQQSPATVAENLISPSAQQLATAQLTSDNSSSKAISKEKLTTAKYEVDLAQITNEPATNLASNSDRPITATATIPTTAPVSTEQVIAQVVDEKSKTDIVDFLAGETKKSEGKLDKLAVNRKKQKWDLGLMLAPSFGNTKELNIGYGMSMSYNFSDRLSLTSGIAYNKMNASKNLPTSIGRSSIILGNSRSLEMINEEVTGIDIPLELKYNINKTVYANLGVSGFAVLNQRRSNTFVEEVVIKSTANNSASIGGSIGAGGASSSNGLEDQKGQFANSYIVSQRTTERATAAAIEDVNYIGFYNFSMGYTKKVYKNHALSIEPFVKLPIKVVTQDNLRLLSTGVRLKVGF